jgi:hypothetical protein
MAESDRDVDAAARLLVDLYGEQARQYACRRGDRLLVDGDTQVRMLWNQVIAVIDQQQRHDPLRVARWRERAQEYRTCADAATSLGSQLAYRVLARCADSVALRLEDLEARRSEEPWD